MPEAETEAKTKETEELSIEVEEPSEDALTDEPEVEQQKTVAKTDELEPEPKPEESTEELEKYSENVNKRIGKLTAKLREAERREKAATEYAQSVQRDLETSQQKTSSLDDSFVTEFENRLGYQETALKNELTSAINRGDVEKQTEIQQQLAQLAVDKNKLDYIKTQKEQAEKQVETKQPETQAKTSPPVDPKAQEWANKNTWFGSDEPMTLTAFSIHKKLIETEGYDGKSDEYYAEIDKRMREEFPHKFDDVTETKSNGRATPPVGGATRGNQRGNQVKIKLNKSEVAIARKLGITNEQYARQKARMQPQS